MKQFATLVILLFACVAGALAQQRVKTDLMLDAYLRSEHPPGEALNLFVHGDPASVEPAVRAVGGTVKMTRPGLSAVRVPVDRVHELAQHPAVERLECALDPGYTLNDSMRVKARVAPIQAGQAPLRMPYDGEDVVVGIIDSGMDWAHPDFRNADNTTRIHRYWDQTLPVNSQTPQPYGYGQVWMPAQINAGQMTSTDLSSGHGSTVAGSAVGNGLANGRHKGVAPKATIIFVTVNFGGNFRANVADAVKYILDEAAALGKPAVVNASVGARLGSHDGLDASALFIDDLLQAAPGRVMVCAAGNFHTQPAYHLRTQVTPDTTWTWFLNNANLQLGGGLTGGVFFEVWADMADFQNVRYAVGADKTGPLRFRGRTDFHDLQENLGNLIVDSLYSLGGNLLGVVQFLALPRGGQVQLQVLIPQPDSANYRFRFMSAGEGLFDVWSHSINGTSNMQVSGMPNPSTFPDIVNYVLPDREMHIVDSWNCSPQVISVANYYSEQGYVRCDGQWVDLGNTEGTIAAESSSGPTRLLLQKPDLAAPGSIALSAAPLSMLPPGGTANPEQIGEGCMHLRNGGTSMASPVVAGTVALYLQKCPQATHLEVADALRTTVFTDAHTPAELPEYRWGYGKLDAFAALLSSAPAVDLGAPEEFCAGEQVALTVPGDLSDPQWSTGSTENVLLVDDEGPVYLVATNAAGCMVYSDTLTFTVHPLPQPSFSQTGNELTSTPAESYQWFLDGVPLPGENGQTHEALVSGFYHVGVTDVNVCYGESSPVQVIVTGIGEEGADGFAVWPSPVRDVLLVRVPEAARNGGTLRVFDARGAFVLERSTSGQALVPVAFDVLAPGTYTVELSTRDTRWTERVARER